MNSAIAKYCLMLVLAGTINSVYGTVIVPADSPAPQQVVVSVGDLKVQTAEFTWKMRGLRTACYNYFTNRYGVYNEVDFWRHSFEGEIPVVWLRKKALQEITEEKRTLLLMQLYGVMNDFSFTGFMAQWLRENKNREQRVAQGAVIYGNISFDVYSYYAYLNANAWMETKRQLLQQSEIGESVLKRHYETIKARQFQKAPIITVVLLTKEKATGKQSSRNIRFEPASRKTDELQWGEVFTRSIRLKQPGDHSEWFTGEAGDLCQVICKTLEERGYIPFDEALENVRSSYAESLLQQALRKDRKKLPVQVNQAVLNQLYLE